ncbi:hypothetical protein HYE67_009061 [Fusarium culmorum]|uniref:Uncharacterized protein n=1 Tax=Fusarium culmorum TaxID=5516 RepID=A0A7S8DDZ9_FUSCU|nr:hypothetical protein HYE67_009061 [Fusarium culmorum]
MDPAGKKLMLPCRDGIGDRTQQPTESISIKSGYSTNDNVNPQKEKKAPVIRPIIIETLDRLDPLIALAKTAGPSDQKTKAAEKAVWESLEA